MLQYFGEPNERNRARGARASAAPVVENDELRHTLVNVEERDNRNRHRRGSCHVCPTTNSDGSRNWSRETSWRCIQCDKYFHPDCFNHYHTVTAGYHEQISAATFTSPRSSNSGSGKKTKRTK